MAGTLDIAIQSIRQIQRHARGGHDPSRPRWPMIVLKSPKGWTGPKFVDGLQIEGTFRAHQVPLLVDADHPDHLGQLEAWMKSYRADELFDGNGRLLPELAALAPEGNRRMGANPHANGGMLLRDLIMPDFRSYAVAVPSPGSVQAADTHVLGEFLRDVAGLNREHRNFRIFGPDETLSNRLNVVFEVTNRQWEARTLKSDEFLSSDGQVMEMLSEHQCEGWLEGYLLTGRHGLFNCYEAFIHIIDSMFNQHAKWLKVTANLPWRRKIASLNYLLASHVWQQAHNGFTHQDPGFIDHVVNKKASIVRVYLPPDANCLLSVWDHCLRSRHYVNVVVAGKYQAPQWLTMGAAVEHCTQGIGVWHWAGSSEGVEPDVVMACCGDVPTLETLAAVSILRRHLPGLKIRVINVVDLMKLEPDTEHPHGLSDQDFDALFTKDKPIVFAFHGYPWLVHRLTYRRTNHENMHVRGYKEEGTITTTFDMTVLNELDRFHLVQDVINRLPALGARGAALKKMVQGKLVEHKQYIDKNGEDMPEIRNWKWGDSR
jgi:xylulose-5-phosphate/fructose-6-phosphate phosphoketolase